MQAKLESGEVIELVKDCECCTHSGPHWLHMNDLWKHRNSELLQQGSLQGHIEEELRRLAEKEHELVSRGIVEILR
jgi:TusA-related sulfurtransferase